MISYLITYIIGIFFVIIFSIYGYKYINLKKISNLYFINYDKYIIISSLFFIATFFILKDLTFQSHHSYVDFSVFLEIFDKYSKGSGLYSSLQKNYLNTGNWLGIHFTPYAIIFAEIFSIFPSYRTIIFLNVFLLGISSLIPYYFLKSRLGSFEAGLCSLILLLNPTFQYITLYEFDFLRFLIPIGLILLGYVFLKDKLNFFLTMILCILCLLIREDVPLFITGIGFYILFIKRDYLIGFSVILISILYFLFVNYYVMPLFREINFDNNFAAYWFTNFGSNPLDIIKSIFSNPLNFFTFILSPIKLANIIMLLVPFLFFPLLSFSRISICIFSLLLLLLSSTHTHISYFLYYVTPIFITLYWGFYFGILNFININYFTNKKEIRLKVIYSIFIGSLVSSIYFGPSPISIQFWNKNFSLAPFATTTFYKERYMITDHDLAIKEISSLIPSDSSVSTEQHLIGNVYKNVSIYGFPFIEGADYIFIDKKVDRKRGLFIDGSWDGFKKYPQFYYDWVENRPDIYDLVANKDGVYLYKKVPNSPFYEQPRNKPE